MMGHGGKRPGAGRPKGARDQAPRSDLPQRAIALVQAHPKWSRVRLAQALGVSRQALWAALKRA